jgi:hypothetical protein
MMELRQTRAICKIQGGDGQLSDGGQKPRVVLLVGLETELPINTGMAASRVDGLHEQTRAYPQQHFESERQAVVIMHGK